MESPDLVEMSLDSNNTTMSSSTLVMACTPYLCPELALPVPMTATFQTILQCIAFALVIVADSLHLLFLVRSARTTVYNRSTITVLCLFSATQITFATANAPLVFLISGIPETITCKLSAFVTAWWRAATSLFLLLSIWQQYAGQITVLAALCAGPKTLEMLRHHTSEAGRQLARRFPVSSAIQVVNVAIVIAIFSLVSSVYTIVLFESSAATFKDYRFHYFFRLEMCTFEQSLISFSRPIFLFDCIFTLLLPLTLASFCLASMHQLPGLAATLFAYNKVHLRIVLKQLNTSCCDLAVPLAILLFYTFCVCQHFAIPIYWLWIWESAPYDTFPKCKRSSDVITLLFPPVSAVFLHVWCRDLVRKENGLYDPGPSLLSMTSAAANNNLGPCDSPSEYQPINNTNNYSPPLSGMPQSLSTGRQLHTSLIPQREFTPPPPAPELDYFNTTVVEPGENSSSQDNNNARFSVEQLSPDLDRHQKTSLCAITIETSL